MADAERDEELLQQDFTGMDIGEGGHRSSPAASVVIDDLHVVRIAAAPAEADTPLVVDPDAVLSLAISFEQLQPVCGRNPQVIERSGGVEHAQLATGDLLDRGRQDRKSTRLNSSQSS